LNSQKAPGEGVTSSSSPGRDVTKKSTGLFYDSEEDYGEHQETGVYSDSGECESFSASEDEHDLGLKFIKFGQSFRVGHVISQGGFSTPLYYPYAYDMVSYVNDIQQCYKNFSGYNWQFAIPIVEYPDNESIDSMDQLAMPCDWLGRYKVYRFSERNNHYSGWVTVASKHLYSYKRFHDNCGCEICIELQDRIYNWIVGIYDMQVSQITGVFDDIENITFELYSERLEHDFKYVCPQSPVQYYPEAGVEFMIEYASCDSLTEMELNDAVPLKELVHGEGDWHVYVFTGVVDKEVLEIFGQIENVTDPVTDETFITDRTYYRFARGTVEHMVVSRTGLKCILNGEIMFDKHEKRYTTIDVVQGGATQLIGENLTVTTKEGFVLERDCSDFVVTSEPVCVSGYIANNRILKPMDMTGAQVMLVGVGTLGDIAPLRDLSTLFRNSGIPTLTIWNGGDVNIQHDGVDAYMRSHMLSIMAGFQALSDVVKIFELLEAQIRFFKPTIIISSLAVVGLEYLAASYRIQLIRLSSVPDNSGAYVFVDQSTMYKEFLAKNIEKVPVFMVKYLPLLKRFLQGRRDTLGHFDNVTTIYTLLPALHECGVGNYKLKALTAFDNNTEYDLCVTLGSAGNKELVEKVFQIVKRLKLKILFQHQNVIEQWSHIDFEKVVNHDKVFKRTTTVLCSGNSGTVQTAIRNGCRVLCLPTWVDQKYMPRLAASKGFQVKMTTLQMLSIDVMSMCRLGKTTDRGKSITDFELFTLISQIYKPVEDIGVFLFSHANNGIVSMLEKSFYGNAHTYHWGIGYNKDYFTEYMELDVTTEGSSVLYSRGQGIDPRIVQIVKINCPFDFEKFVTCANITFNMRENCRRVVTNYCKLYNIDVGEIISQRRWTINDRGCGDIPTPLYRKYIETFYNAHGRLYTYRSLSNNGVVYPGVKSISKYCTLQEQLIEHLCDNTLYFESNDTLEIAKQYDLRICIYRDDTIHLYNERATKTLHLIYKDGLYARCFTDIVVKNDVSVPHFGKPVGHGKYEYVCTGVVDDTSQKALCQYLGTLKIVFYEVERGGVSVWTIESYLHITTRFFKSPYYVRSLGKFNIYEYPLLVDDCTHIYTSHILCYNADCHYYREYIRMTPYGGVWLDHSNTPKKYLMIGDDVEQYLSPFRKK
jgi:hypothetical protein